MAINWRERVIAAAIHFTVTLLVASAAAIVIFFIWFPGATAAMVGGTKLFVLVTVSDVILGPLLSLVIYSSKKSRMHLVGDYCVIGAVQLASLIYGMLVVADSRPVFIAFSDDRLHLVTAFELTDLDLKGGVSAEFQSKSWTGPRLISIAPPANASERNEVDGYASIGKDVQTMPKYYRPYDAARAQIMNAERSLQSLLENSNGLQPQIESAIRSTGKANDQLRWLLVDHRFGTAVALMDVDSIEPLKYLAIDPIWTKVPAKAPQ
jgi:hypothetical protein